MISLGFTVSNVLFSWMSVSQTAVAGVLGVFLGIVSADKSSDKENLEEGANEYLNEYNLARHELQNQMLELEKVLAQHTKDINNLRLNNVMDFSENFKKKEKQTAYM